MDEITDPIHLSWENKFALGIKSFDDQHHHLVNILNELHVEYERIAVELSRLNLIAKELIDFTVYSLDYEADCLVQFEYHDLLLHLEQHELFKEKANWFKDKLSSNTIEQNQLICTIRNIWKFLYLWLNDHISISDKKYMNLLLQNGMK